MNTSKIARFALALVAINAFHATSQAATEYDDENMIGYEQILKELSRDNAGTIQGSAPRNQDPFANIMIHGGVGFVSTFGQVHLPGETIHLNQNGVQATLGIDLFSQNWFAEGSARSFSEAAYGSSQVALREFDLKVYYRDRITKTVGYRLGAGLAARYMTIDSTLNGHTEFTTPASVVSGGLEIYVTRSVSLGGEMAARNAMIGDTGDRSSLDATVRMDAHF